MTARRMAQALVAAALVAAGCSDPGGPRNGPGLASLSLAIPAPPELTRFAPGLVVERVRTTVYRIVNDVPDTVTSRVTPFAVDQNTIAVSFTLVLPSAAETLSVAIDYETLSGQVLFQATQQVVARAGQPSIPLGTAVPFFVGPGSNIAFVSLAPADTSVAAGDSLAYDATAIDSSQAPVTTFYVSWQTDDPRVAINAKGVLRAPAGLTRLVLVTARTPNGTLGSTTVTLLGPAALALLPDSVEKLPGGTQQFVVTVGGTRTSQFTWSVNGVDGGNATFGTIDTAGFYTAPAAVPSPARFQVCARETQIPTRQGCATMIIVSAPSAGADLIVFNDINTFVDLAIPNARLIKNLVKFPSTGPRGQGTVVWHELAHSPRCLQPIVGCDPSQLVVMDSVIATQGYSTFDFLQGQLTNIPANVRAIFLWTPQVVYDTAEVNALKQFAAEGGRIIFLGERLPYYGSGGVAIENLFLTLMGAQLTNIAADSVCGDSTNNFVVRVTGNAIKPHQVTTNVSGVSFSCSSIIALGPNDYALVYTPSITSVLGAVAKIDLTPLPAAPAFVRPRVVTAPAAGPPVRAGGGP